MSLKSNACYRNAFQISTWTCCFVPDQSIISLWNGNGRNGMESNIVCTWVRTFPICMEITVPIVIFSIWNNKQNSRKVCFAMLSLFWCKFREIVWAQHTSPYLAPSESGLKLIRAWWILRAPSPYSSGRNLLDFLFAKAKIPVQNVVNVALQFDLFCAEGGKLFPLFNRLKLGR